MSKFIITKRDSSGNTLYLTKETGSIDLWWTPIERWALEMTRENAEELLPRILDAGTGFGAQIQES